MTNTWKTFFQEEALKPYYSELQNTLKQELKKHIVFPKKEHIYRAFEETPLDKVKVVILGQDPYHGEEQAEGLSFSVKKDMKLPPSLKNIFKEYQQDLGFEAPTQGSLLPWAKEGVFLLNSSLTVRKSDPGSHAKIGWHTFTDNAIQYINNNTDAVVFILWGAHAHKKESLIDSTKHEIIKSTHPSPFSAHKGFLGSKPFTKANDFLCKHQKKPINWSL